MSFLGWIVVGAYWTKLLSSIKTSFPLRYHPSSLATTINTSICSKYCLLKRTFRNSITLIGSLEYSPVYTYYPIYFHNFENMLSICDMTSNSCVHMLRSWVCKYQ